MSALAVSAIVFACVLGGALIGMMLRAVLPQHHLNAEAKEVVHLGIGLIGTMTALVLGLLISSGKNSYDADKGNVTQMSAKIVYLDRMLALYGSRAQEARGLFRDWVAHEIDEIWPQDASRSAELDPTANDAVPLYNKIQQLTPEGDSQRWLKDSAMGTGRELGEIRWLLFEQAGKSISTPFLVVVVSWLTVIFISFGLFAPRNATVIVVLTLCALSASAAIFLILELDHPFDGIVQISGDTMRNALAHLGR